MIEFVRWQVLLWLAGFRDRVVSRERRLTMYYADYGWPERWLRDLVERISPFDPLVGYRRVVIRRVLWKVTHPLITERLASLRWVIRILNLVAYTGPGRYEQFDGPSRMKVEWLDSNTELASDTTGESEGFGIWVAAFVDFDVPWSRMPENWLLSVNSFGFVAAEVFDDEDDLMADFGETVSRYTRWLINNDPAHVYES